MMLYILLLRRRFSLRRSTVTWWEIMESEL